MNLNSLFKVRKLSLTVLVHYLSHGVYLALDGVYHLSLGCIFKQPDSAEVPTGSLLAKTS